MVADVRPELRRRLPRRWSSWRSLAAGPQARLLLPAPGWPRQAPSCQLSYRRASRDDIAAAR
jgi:hypothetical protein